MNDLRITLVQGELAWEDAATNRDRLETRIAQAGASDLIVLPEMFSTGFSMRSDVLAESMQGETVAWMKRQAANLGVSVCGSLIIEESGRYFNRFVLARPDGALATYDKRHLFRMGRENEHYAPGAARMTFRIGDFIICPQICYDLRFPAFSRNRIGTEEAFDLLLFVANWPAPRREHWRTLLRARAIENQCYVVGVNRIGVDGNGLAYSGDSMAIGFGGEILADLADADDWRTVTLLRGALDEYRRAFPAWMDADRFELPGDRDASPD